ncbi:exostosin-2 [Plakobranchus ocellatus]|uniref:Exostosin-2 n=1 Tax=Plakobranchus ocellatus TaxID=259542 RepID=A0AAV3YK60_9GAST|nr:exostosin-2 [Plakobranchus ocellatus]
MSSVASSSSLVAEAQLQTMIKTRRKLPSFYASLGILGTFLVVIVICIWWFGANIGGSIFVRDLPAELQTRTKLYLTSDSPIPEPRDLNCTFHNYSCSEVHHCGYDDSTTISVYIYPLQQYFDEKGNDITPPMSREFEEILRVIANSPYYTNDPETACVFLPSIDLLNQNFINPDQVGKILASLPWWNDGKNHILINMLPGSPNNYHDHLGVNMSKAMVAGGGFSTITYRRTFDLSIPVYNPLLEGVELTAKPFEEERRWFLLSSQFGLHATYKAQIEALTKAESTVMMMDQCDSQNFNYSIRCDYMGHQYSYPEVLQDSTFCLVIRGNRLGQPTFMDVLMAGCIPVVVADGYVMPFSEVLDWTRASVHIIEEHLPIVYDILKKYSPERIVDMRRQIHYYWQRYFKSLPEITMMMMQIFNDRFVPFVAKNSDEWNDLPNKAAFKSPLFLPIKAPKAVGFTVVILTFDRIDSLFQVVRQVGRVPSLAKILIIWNNQDIKPPPLADWPNIGKPLKIIQTKFNRLSNRFYPYDDIQTECVLALDDDIVMLTPDEIEFGYEVWREHPDRLVGYPSRLHLWQNDTQSFSYESEWMNQISMVLTGAAFHHKYYSFMYTYGMPGNIKQWVDEHINCEDIAMNFLVTNVTGKAPIKVVPRKKFKCPECVKEMLSASSSHMVHRSECINMFIELYGGMPLKPIEFRADPLLYKDNLPGVLRKFRDLGTL